MNSIWLYMSCHDHVLNWDYYPSAMDTVEEIEERHEAWWA